MHVMYRYGLSSTGTKVLVYCVLHDMYYTCVCMYVVQHVCNVPVAKVCAHFGVRCAAAAK
jgi:hypothetical protein